MNKVEILNEIKKKMTCVPDERIFRKVLERIETDEPEPKTAPVPLKLRILRPAVIFYVIILVIASSFAVTAAVNKDIRGYLVSIFGGNPNPVEGEVINVTSESEGISLTVDAVVAEGDSLFMIYTLDDKARTVIRETTEINRFEFKVGDDPNFNASYNTTIKNGGKNYMTLNSDSIRKGIQNIEFSISSIKIPDPAKEFEIMAGTENYKPLGIDGYVIDYVRLKNNRLEAFLTISDQSQYVHNYLMKVCNIRTGNTFYQKGEISGGNSKDEIKTIQWFSEELDGGNSEDYQLVISFDKVYSFEKPLQVNFAADFSKKPVKTVEPEDIHVLTARVDKISIYQMIIIADLTDTSKKPAVNNVKPVQASEADVSFLSEEPDKSSVHSQRMLVRYEDGSEAESISSSSSSEGDNGYRIYLVLNGSLDYSRRPELYIGDVKIPLY